MALYLGVAALAGGLWFVGGSGRSILSDLGAFGPLTLMDGVATVLIAAAFHLRHPDAWSDHRLLSIAMVLLATSEVLQPVGAILAAYGWFPAALGNPSAIHLGLGLSLVTSTVGLLAAALLWLGVRRARRRTDRPGWRLVRVAIWMAAGIMLLNGSGLFRSIAEARAVETMVFAGHTAAVSILRTLVAAAFATVLVGGARAGERPSGAWGLAATGEVAVLLGMAFYPLIILALGGAAVDATVYVQLPQTISLIGSLLLLAAFALGLPSRSVPDVPPSPPGFPPGGTM